METTWAVLGQRRRSSTKETLILKLDRYHTHKPANAISAFILFASVVVSGCGDPPEWRWDDNSLDSDQKARQAELIRTLPYPRSMEGDSAIPHSELFSLADEVGTHIDGQTKSYRLTIPDSGDDGSSTEAWFMVRDDCIVEVNFEPLNH